MPTALLTAAAEHLPAGELGQRLGVLDRSRRQQSDRLVHDPERLAAARAQPQLPTLARQQGAAIGAAVERGVDELDRTLVAAGETRRVGGAFQDRRPLRRRGRDLAPQRERLFVQHERIGERVRAGRVVGGAHRSDQRPRRVAGGPPMMRDLATAARELRARSHRLRDTGMKQLTLARQQLAGRCLAHQRVTEAVGLPSSATSR